MLVNWDAEKIIWDRLFSKDVLNVSCYWWRELMIGQCARDLITGDGAIFQSTKYSGNIRSNGI